MLNCGLPKLVKGQC